LVAPDGLVFFTDGSLCGGRAGAGLFSDILNALAGAKSSFAFVRPELCLPLAPSSVKRVTAPHGAWRLLVVSRKCS
jgi:hypothetical protein